MAWYIQCMYAGQNDHVFCLKWNLSSSQLVDMWTLRITSVGHIKSHVNPENAITCSNRFVMWCEARVSEPIFWEHKFSSMCNTYRYYFLNTWPITGNNAPFNKVILIHQLTPQTISSILFYGVSTNLVTHELIALRRTCGRPVELAMLMW